MTDDVNLYKKATKFAVPKQRQINRHITPPKRRQKVVECFEWTHCQWNKGWQTDGRMDGRI